MQWAFVLVGFCPSGLLSYNSSIKARSTNFNIGAASHLGLTIAMELVQLSKLFERKIVNIFLPISFNICFWCPKGLCSFEYLQHIFFVEKLEN